MVSLILSSVILPIARFELIVTEDLPLQHLFGLFREPVGQVIDQVVQSAIDGFVIPGPFSPFGSRADEV